MRLSVPSFAWFAALALTFACSKPAPVPAAPAPSASTAASTLTGDAGVASSSFPGHDPPPLADLLKIAQQTPASGSATPYQPEAVDVPAIVPVQAELLPKAANEHVILQSTRAVALTYRERFDPITAAAGCFELTTGCVQPAEIENGRTRDSCVASAKTCKTNHPWDEKEACCPERCQALYASLRQANYPAREAWALTRDSNCFPSSIEFMDAARAQDAKGTP